jgi:hypothetical protein
MAGLDSRVCMAGLFSRVCPGGTKHGAVDSPGGPNTATWTVRGDHRRRDNISCTCVNRVCSVVCWCVRVCTQLAGYID